MADYYGCCGHCPDECDQIHRDSCIQGCNDTSGRWLCPDECDCISDHGGGED